MAKKGTKIYGLKTMLQRISGVDPRLQKIDLAISNAEESVELAKSELSRAKTNVERLKVQRRELKRQLEMEGKKTGIFQTKEDRRKLKVLHRAEDIYNTVH